MESKLTLLANDPSSSTLTPLSIDAILATALSKSFAIPEGKMGLVLYQHTDGIFHIHLVLTLLDLPGHEAQDLPFLELRLPVGRELSLASLALAEKMLKDMITSLLQSCFGVTQYPKGDGIVLDSSPTKPEELSTSASVASPGTKTRKRTSRARRTSSGSSAALPGQLSLTDLISSTTNMLDTEPSQLGK
jgi:hypothetical protein